MTLDIIGVLWSVFGPILMFFVRVVLTALTVFFALLVYCLLKYRVNPFHLSESQLRRVPIRMKLFSFICWAILDSIERAKSGSRFYEYGFTIYCGRQGGGKTVSMVNYLNRIHEKFPDTFIVTNFQYEHATHVMESWQDFLEIRNGTDGVVFALDEIHSEYSNAAWKTFPEVILSEISQQRKQRVKIVATAQVYSRIVKQIREQCFSVVVCKTLAGRWTFCREYDAFDYEMYIDSANLSKKKLKPFRKWSFVQDCALRSSYDTYEKIERLRKMDFVSRSERGC